MTFKATLQAGIESLVSHTHSAMAQFDVFALIVLNELVVLEGIHVASSHKKCSPRRFAEISCTEDHKQQKDLMLA